MNLMDCDVPNNYTSYPKTYFITDKNSSTCSEIGAKSLAIQDMEVFMRNPKVAIFSNNTCSYPSGISVRLESVCDIQPCSTSKVCYPQLAKVDPSSGLIECGYFCTVKTQPTIRKLVLMISSAAKICEAEVKEQ